MDWKNIIKSVAPVIGTALGGPMGGGAVRFLSKKLLGDENATEEELAQFVQTASPDQLLSIKKMDREYDVQMKKLGVDILRIDAEDSTSARHLASVDMRPHVVLSVVYTLAYAALVFMVVTGHVKAEDSMMALVMAVVGSLTTAQTSILNFWFGSSSGSKEKAKGAH